jgi:hypothetical protein
MGNIESKILQEKLLEKIMAGIEAERAAKAIKRRIAAFIFLMIISAVSFIYSLSFIYSDFQNSGFFYFISLALLDWKEIIHYWQSFSLAVLESFPAISSAIFLFFVFIFLWSLKLFAKNLNNYYGLQQNLAVKNV